MKANKLTFKGSFCLKSGYVVNEEVVFDESNNQEDIDTAVKDIRDSIKEGFKNNKEFQLNFGTTMFRGSDISAVTFTLE